MRNLVIILAVLFLVVIGRNYYRRNPQAGAQMLRKLLIGGGIALLLVLALTGRLHWLIAVIAASVPVFMRLLPLFKYVPFLKTLLNRAQGAAHTGPTGRQSSVRSAFLNMTLDHDSGEMDGEIIQGQFKGRYLHQLKLIQLIQLLNECSSDHDSSALLQTYLDRVHDGWRDQAQYQQSQGPDNGDRMSEEEAWQILGLVRGASEDQIVAAHRRLMQKMHPDRGGSTYLAAKINLAKEFLLTNL